MVRTDPFIVRLNKQRKLGLGTLRRFFSWLVEDSSICDSSTGKVDKFDDPVITKASRGSARAAPETISRG